MPLSTTEPGTWTLGHLADLRRSGGDDAVRSLVGGAALVVGTWAANGPARLDGTEARPRRGARDTAVAGRHPSRELDLADPSLLVLPLRKTGRNPFGQVVTVGRDETNDIVLASRSVSRVHAWLQRRDGQWHVRDRNSTNGTLVDCVRLEERAECLLVHDHVLRFGDVTARFVELDGLVAVCGSVDAGGAVGA